MGERTLPCDSLCWKDHLNTISSWVIILCSEWLEEKIAFCYLQCEGEMKMKMAERKKEGKERASRLASQREEAENITSPKSSPVPKTRRRLATRKYLQTSDGRNAFPAAGSRVKSQSGTFDLGKLHTRRHTQTHTHSLFTVHSLTASKPASKPASKTWQKTEMLP